MRDVAAAARRWLAQGLPGVLARTAAVEGLGARPLDALAWTAGERAGALLGGAVDGPVLDAAQAMVAGGEQRRVVDVEIGDAEATVAGLTCGGSARVAIDALAATPPALWEAVADGAPAAWAIRLDGAGGHLVLVGRDGQRAGTLGRPDLDAAAVDAAGEALRAHRPARVLLARPGPEVLVEVMVPPARLLIVGAADLAAHLGAQAALLGWEAQVAAGRADAEAALAGLGRGDAVVVLSHDGAVDAPVLAAALGRGVGFVGALGSRRTQARRAEGLRALGVAEAAIAAIHGPVGLDLGAATPAETALAICAEIVAVRAGRDARPLRQGAGPIH